MIENDETGRGGTTATEGRRRLSGEERRASILAAAAPIFARKGYHAAATAEIAAAAGCSEPILYRHFPSKLDLFVAVLRDAARAKRDEARARVSVERDPAWALAAVPRRFLGDPAFPELVRLRGLALAMSDVPAVREALLEGLDGLRQVVVDALAESQRLGSLRQDVDPDHLGWVWFGLTMTAGVRHALEGDDGLRAMGEITDTFLSLLRPPAEEVRDDDD